MLVYVLKALKQGEEKSQNMGTRLGFFSLDSLCMYSRLVSNSECWLQTRLFEIFVSKKDLY